MWALFFVAEVAQVVERRPEKPGVPSASLGLGTCFPYKRFCGSKYGNAISKAESRYRTI